MVSYWYSSKILSAIGFWKEYLMSRIPSVLREARNWEWVDYSCLLSRMASVRREEVKPKRVRRRSMGRVKFILFIIIVLKDKI